MEAILIVSKMPLNSLFPKATSLVVGEIPPSSHGVLLMDGTWLVEERNKEFSS
jgi:hypothetical protein